MRPQKPHYLRANHREASPRRLLIFDSETQPVQVGKRTVQVLRLWDADYVDRNNYEQGYMHIESDSGETSAQLVDTIERFSKGAGTLWIYAHNLAFDLTVTKIPVLLIAAGWKLTEHALFADSPWARFRKGNKRIVLVDSFSVLPTSVERIGIAIGIQKPALPDWDDSEEAWHYRCAEDVKIVRTALLDCMEWWDKNKLGNWSITGPSIGWSSFRHGNIPVKISIDPDQQARDFERLSLMGGRREVWRVGQQMYGTYLDIDFEHAHLTVCAEEKLPYRRMQPFDSLPVDSQVLYSHSLDIIAEVEIETTVPRYPVKLDTGIFYPVGRFKTVLAGPEIREALKRGELVSIGHGYMYMVAHTMRPWSLWLQRVMEGKEADTPIAVQILVKGWSRTVPGKWASRTSDLVMTLPDQRPGWYAEEGAVMPGYKPAVFMTIGGQQQVYVKDLDADDSFPAVLAFIQSHTRVALGRLIDALGDSVLQCNTDGCMVDAVRWLDFNKLDMSEAQNDSEILAGVAEHKLRELRDVTHPIRARIKRAARRVEIISPQHTILDSELKLSGIPRNAVEVSRNKYNFMVWPKMPYQLSKGSVNGYVNEYRTVDISRVPVNRWRAVDGFCEPVKVNLSNKGINTLELPPMQFVYDHGLAPTEQQHRELQKVMRGCFDDDIRPGDPSSL